MMVERPIREMKTMHRSWGIGSPYANEWLTMILFALVVAGIVQLLYKVGYVKKERRSRILGIVLAIALAIGVVLGIAGI